jgi:hypothetical protein
VSTLGGVLRRSLLGAALAVTIGSCDGAPPDPAVRPVDEILGAIALSEAEPPTGTTYFRGSEGPSAVTRLVQDDDLDAQVTIQRGLVDAVSREFGTPGVIAMLVEGAPTESLDPAGDLWVASAASAYADAGAARAALSVLLEETDERQERRRNVAFGDGGAVFRGHFLRGMPIVTYVWGTRRFVLHLMVVGALAPAESRTIARDMAKRAQLRGASP